MFMVTPLFTTNEKLITDLKVLNLFNLHIHVKVFSHLYFGVNKTHLRHS